MLWYPSDHHTTLTIFIGKGSVRQSVLEDPSQREWFPIVESGNLHMAA